MGFNDATFLGWLTTGMYFAAAALCAIAGRWPARAISHNPATSRRVAYFWTALACGLILLAINKQLDAQTALTNLLRDIAEKAGWYGRRRMWQVIFVVIAAAALGGLIWGAHRLLDRQWRSHRLALAGVALIAAYLMLRIVDIERIGDITGLPLSAQHARAVVEWMGLGCVALAAWRSATGLLQSLGHAQQSDYGRRVR